jgi:hypothetical protein
VDCGHFNTTNTFFWSKFTKTLSCKLINLFLYKLLLDIQKNYLQDKLTIIFLIYKIICSFIIPNITFIIFIITETIQPQLQLVNLHRNRRYFVIKLHTWFCLSYFLKTNIEFYSIYQYFMSINSFFNTVSVSRYSRPITVTRDPD